MKTERFSNLPIYKLFFSQLFIHTNTQCSKNTCSQIVWLEIASLIRFTNNRHLKIKEIISIFIWLRNQCWTNANHLTEAERKVATSDRSSCPSPDISHLNNANNFQWKMIIEIVFTFRKHDRDDYRYHVEQLW